MCSASHPLPFGRGLPGGKVKGSLAVLSIFGLVSLWMAVGIGDMGLSFAVILNGLRNNNL